MKKASGAPCKKHGAPEGFYSLAAYAITAAAAGIQNDGNDDQPKSAVIKQIAKTIIHMSFLHKIDRGAECCSSVIIL